MLETLAYLDGRRARMVLSRASDRLLPKALNHFAADKVADEEEERLTGSVIEELKARVYRQNPADDEEELRLKIIDELSREVTRIVLADVDPADIRKRMGDIGRLPASLYELRFSPKFINGAKMWGLSRSYVENAVKRCEQVEHRRTEMEIPTAPPHTSLFTQTPATRQLPYTILVKAQRLNDILLIDEAYRIYHDEIDLAGAYSPFAVLERFVAKLGVETIIKVDDQRQTTIVGKLIDKRTFKVPLGKSLRLFRNGVEEMSIRQENRDDDRVEINLSYGINNEAYVAYLARHGVKATAPKAPMTGISFRGVAPNNLRRT